MGGISKRQSFKLKTLLILLLTISLLGGGCGFQELETAPPGELIIEGEGVEGRTAFTLDDLQSMEGALVEADYFGINSYGTKSHTHFKGIGVWHILNSQAGLKDGASLVTFTAEDGYEVQYSIAEVKKEDYIDEENPAARLKMILAWEENGYESDPRAGMPLQLVVGQKATGDVNRPYWVKNVVRIRVD